MVNVESISPVNSYMSLWGTIKASIKSYATGKPTNSMVRPAAVFEPNLALWVKHFILNSSEERILHHSEGKNIVALDPVNSNMLRPLKNCDKFEFHIIIKVQSLFDRGVYSRARSNFRIRL